MNLENALKSMLSEDDSYKTLGNKRVRKKIK